jgi:hypothetical protein
MMMEVPNTSIGERMHRFWFRPISATGFGLMRIAFGMTTMLNLLLVRDVLRFYGPEGILPRHMAKELLRQEWRFSLIDTVGAGGTLLLYLLLWTSLLFVTLGIRTRLALLISLVLLYSFHEYGAILRDSGDMLSNTIGFILLLAPCDRACTLQHLRHRLVHSAAKPVRTLPPPRTIPIWPYRLLLWQVAVMYMSSAYGKISGAAWPEGWAVAVATHHVHFARFPTAFADWLARFSPFLSTFVVYTQLGWGLLLTMGLLNIMQCSFNTKNVKRILLFNGLLIHGGIFLIMDMGVFSFAVFTAYLGLLLDEDLTAIKKLLLCFCHAHPRDRNIM